MEKYKICPSCGTKNEPSLLECSECETDLTRVKVTDKENESIPEPACNHVPSCDTERICECGAKNPPNMRKCSSCGEDISDIIPTPVSDNKPNDKKQRIVLSSLDGKYAYIVTESEITVGREEKMSEYLSSKSFVSRMHAKLNISDGSLFVSDLNTTNGTYVNNNPITAAVQLHDGDELALGGIEKGGSRQTSAAYFLVRIGECI